jgi:heme/copper-type cytochrome/quinol oxidase subunit 2
MRRRIYWLLPHLSSARRIMDDLLLARVSERYIHFVASEGTDLTGLHAANVLQTSDMVASVAFHLLTRWWLSPLAPNWQATDDTRGFTVVVTGIFFVAINLLVVATLLRYRHQPSGKAKAANQPVNRRLELGLIGVTTVGIVALLASGLAVCANYVQALPQAMALEVVGQQWQWR